MLVIWAAKDWQHGAVLGRPHKSRPGGCLPVRTPARILETWLMIGNMDGFSDEIMVK